MFDTLLPISAFFFLLLVALLDSFAARARLGRAHKHTHTHTRTPPIRDLLLALIYTFEMRYSIFRLPPAGFGHWMTNFSLSSYN